MTRSWLRPAVRDGQALKVPRPERGDYLPADGDDIELSVYWRRRLRDGDVTRGEAPKPAAAQPKPKKEGSGQ